MNLNTSAASDGPPPPCAARSFSHAAWFTFTTDSAGAQLEVDTFGSDYNYDTVVAIYTGGCGALTPASNGCNDDTIRGPYLWQSEVSLPSTLPDTTYYIVVTSYAATGGNLTITLRYGAPTPTPSPAPTFRPGLSCAAPMAVTSGVPVIFSTSGTANGTAPPCGGGSSALAAWFTYTTDGTGQPLTVNTFGSTYDTILAVYSGGCGALAPASGGCNDDANGALQSQVVLPSTLPNTTYIIEVTSYRPTGGTLVLNLTYGTPPTATPSAIPTVTPTRTPTPAGTLASTSTATPTATPTATATPGIGSTCQNPLSLVSGIAAMLSTTANADGIGQSCGNGSAHRAAWAIYTTDAAGRSLTVNTFGSNYDTILGIYTGACGALVPVSGGCNDDASGLQSQVSLATTTPNTTYYIEATSYGTAAGYLTLTLTYGP